MWTGHLNLAVSVYKEAIYQKSDFFQVQQRVVIWGFYEGKSAKNEPKIDKFQNLVITFDCIEWGEWYELLGQTGLSTLSL